MSENELNEIRASQEETEERKKMNPADSLIDDMMTQEQKYEIERGFMTSVLR